MLTNLQFLRPVWLLLFIPLVLLGITLFKTRLKSTGWQNFCDPELISRLIFTQNRKRYILPFILLMAIGTNMIIALAGPAWKKINVPTYQQIQPRVILLDMSEKMLEKDLSPDRLSRAKFKLHDLLKQKDHGQFALIAYTSEPFVVSPLTDDAQTIDALIPALTENVMPIGGHNLNEALLSAKELFKASGSNTGDILVLSANIPNQRDVNQAKKLAAAGIHTSILPMLANKGAGALFLPFAKAGQGRVVNYSFDDKDIVNWLQHTQKQSAYKAQDMKNIPLMEDEGRIFVLIAIILLLPFFKRGYFARING